MPKKTIFLSALCQPHVHVHICTCAHTHTQFNEYRAASWNAVHIPPGSNDLICTGSECIDIMSQASRCHHAPTSFNQPIHRELLQRSNILIHFLQRSHRDRDREWGCMMIALPSFPSFPPKAQGPRAPGH